MRFVQQLSRRHMTAALMALSLISSLAAPRGSGRLRQLAATLLAPAGHSVYYITTRVEDNIRDLSTGSLDAESANRLRAENESLRNALVAYEDRLVWLETQVADIGNWHVDLDRDFPCRLIAGIVIAHGGGPYSHDRLIRTRERALPGAPATTRSLLIERPTAVPKDLAVLSSTSVVGRVVDNGAWTATLQLLTDPSFSIRGRIKRIVDPNQPRIIQTEGGAKRTLRDSDPTVQVNLRGTGGKLMITAESPAHHNILPGDYVVTLGSDGWLPTGVLIGTVAAVLPVANNPNHVQIEVKPAADLDNLQHVYIVQPKSTGGR